jgi:hypothetical protein
MSSLVDKAKEVKRRTKSRDALPNGMQYSDKQVLELAEAWLSDEIVLRQYCFAIGSVHSGNALYTIASILKVHYRLGRIKINYKK